MTVCPNVRGAPLRGRLYRRVVFAGAQGAAREKCIPGRKRVQAPCGARVRAAIGLAPWAAQVPPTERAGSKGSYKCGLPAAVVGAFKNERRHDDKIEESPCGRSPVVWFFIPRSGITKLIARRAIPQPSAPQAPSNLRTLRTFGPPGPSTLTPKGETTHYDLCVALLLQIMFAVHAEGVSKCRHHPLNPPAESGQNLLNLLNPGRSAALFISTV